jgi:hypothetical protein
LSPPSGVAAGEDIGPVRESSIDSQGEEAVERLREGESSPPVVAHLGEKHEKEEEGKERRTVVVRR